MKDKKERGIATEVTIKNTENNWKVKALDRQVTIRKQEGRIKELILSRDRWRSKYYTLRTNPVKEAVFSGQKARGHQFSLVVVLLLVKWQRYGRMSLRSCRHCFCELCLILGLNIRIPSHVTLRWWVCKCGYYRIEKRPPQRLPYVVYIDESIVIGGEKLFLVLGVLASAINYQTGLDFSKMEVLSISSSASWKAEAIEGILQKIDREYLLSYVVSDNGTNLKRACQLSSYIHVEDCTHYLANVLKGIYKGNEAFEGFCKSAKALRKNWYLSKEKSIYMPPTQRGKVRFANIFPVVNWSSKWIEKWSEIPEHIQKDLAFLMENKVLINQLMSLENVLGQVCKILKNNGYSLENKSKIMSILAQEDSSIFSQKVTEYLDRLEQKRTLLNQENIVCCSDIIESFFGKFKMKLDSNSPKKMTEFMYTMANFGKEFTEKEIKGALETIQIKDLKTNKNRGKIIPFS